MVAGPGTGEVGPNKRRAGGEAARLSVKWDRSIHRWNMEMFHNMYQHKWADWKNENPSPKAKRTWLRSKETHMTPSVFVFVAACAIGVHKDFKSGQICVELRPDLVRWSPLPTTTMQGPRYNAQGTRCTRYNSQGTRCIRHNVQSTRCTRHNPQGTSCTRFGEMIPSAHNAARPLTSHNTEHRSKEMGGHKRMRNW